MDWLNISAEAGLWGMLAASFLSATLLPGGSEALLFAFLRLHPDQLWLALMVATLGNTAGGMTSWACGRWLPACRVLPKWQRLERIPHREQVARWGSPILLLAWAPIIGDALCVAAGWLRLHWLPCTVFMAIGKAARYGLVAQGALA